jgi:hypothetical protein
LPATVRTGRDGAIELRQGATSVNVGPDTQLEFPALEVPGGPIDRIRQSRGNVFYDVGRRGSRKLRIETTFLVAVVKGTQFNVAASDDTTTIALFEGLLEIRSTTDNDVVDIVAGEIASRHRADADIGVIKFDETRSAPAPSAPPGAEGGDRDAPATGAPHDEVAEGDEYLVRDDNAGHEAVSTQVLADARIDLGATDTLVASLVNPGPPGVGAAGSPAPVIDAPVIDAPVIDTPVIDTGVRPDPDPVGELIDLPSPPPAGAGSVPEPVVDSPLSDDAGADVGADNGGVNVGVGVDVPVVGGNVGVDVDLGIDLNGDDANSNSGSSDSSGNGNAYGHDKDNANGEANGHDKDDSSLLEEVVEDVVSLLDNLRKPGKK